MSPSANTERTDTATETVFELDPSGDITFLVYNVPQSLPYSLQEIHPSILDGLPDQDASSEVEQEQEQEEEPLTNGTEDVETGWGKEETKKHGKAGSRRSSDQRTRRLLRIRASSKHLTLGSPQFERTLQAKFREGTTLQEKGYVEIPVHEWNAIPFLLLMMIVHGKMRAVPRKLSLERLAEMAVLVDYYECYEITAVLSDMWIDALADTLPTTLTVGAVRWICISWVFQRREIFKSMTRIVMLESTTRLRPSGLPIPTAIIDNLEKSRERAISDMMGSFHHLYRQLLNGQRSCSFRCECALLGALVKKMQKLNIMPHPEPPFRNISAKQFMKEGLQGLDSSMWSVDDYNDNYYYRGGHLCDLLPKVEPLLRNVERSTRGLDIEQFASLRTDMTL